MSINFIAPFLPKRDVTSDTVITETNGSNPKRTYDYEGDGRIDRCDYCGYGARNHYSEYYEYDENGNPKRTLRDNDGDGQADWVRESFYGTGTIYRESTYVNGKLDNIFQEEYTPDQHGRESLSRRMKGYVLDILGEAYIHYIHEENYIGGHITTTRDISYNSSGQECGSSENSFDLTGKLTKNVKNEDANRDGKVDYVITTEYDKNGDITLQKTEDRRSIWQKIWDLF